ncbi:uncharacterized protein LOC141514643 [Macrotis lagotis]|uniref:uncharacterized protein LOC141514643 n=1 Tax=Macrotis lagotis TaxID=92651 RepID=UPI003D69CBB3
MHAGQEIVTVIFNSEYQDFCKAMGLSGLPKATQLEFYFSSKEDTKEKGVTALPQKARFKTNWGLLFFFLKYQLGSQSMDSKSRSEIKESIPKQEEKSSQGMLMERLSNSVAQDSMLGEVWKLKAQFESQVGNQGKYIQNITFPHIKRSTEEKGSESNENWKNFNLRPILVTKQSVSVEERLYTCDVHEKSFKQNAYLMIHQQINEGNKPCKCNECETTFRGCTSLIQHQRIHNGVKSYEFNEYGKAFSQSTHLTNHQKIHTGEKFFKCNDCDKAFSYCSALL